MSPVDTAMTSHTEMLPLSSLSPPRPGGRVPAFAKSLGMDFIITPEGGIVLLELQHGFGRKGLKLLFSPATRTYRRTYYYLLRQHGRRPGISKALRPVCTDKLRTYKVVGRFQPASFAYQGPSAKLSRWLDGLASELVIAKPPRGVCGRGIRVVPREAFRRDPEAFQLDKPMILQEFVESRRIDDEQGLPHVGCIRHVSILHSDGETLGFVHLPSYWRVAPAPFHGLDDREGLTANISRGAYPVALSDEEELLVRCTTEAVGLAVMQHVLALPDLGLGGSWTISAAGELSQSR